MRVVLQEPEVFAIHQRDLAGRAGEYGRDFLGRALFACALGSQVYVQASRERRKMTEEMRAALRHHDALLTIGPGPAPRFDAHDTFGYVYGLWGKANLTSPFSVTGFPALSVCSGFSSRGLPLSVQIAGRPFDDATVLRIGHGYETATAWRKSRPTLSLGQEHPPIQLAPDPVAHDLDARTRTYIECCVEQAGLTLSDSEMDLLYTAAPHAMAMARRIRIDYDWADESSSVFRL